MVVTIAPLLWYWLFTQVSHLILMAPCKFVIPSQLTFLIHINVYCIGFSTTPSSYNATVNEETTFRCEHPHAVSLIWIINGTSHYEYLPPNTSVQESRASGGRGLSSLLNFASCHNNTTIECLAVYEGYQWPERSPEVIMRCQGLCYHIMLRFDPFLRITAKYHYTLVSFLL